MDAEIVAAKTDLRDILAELDAALHIFPEAALLAARQEREAITPHLIESLRAAAATARSGGEVRGNLPLFAMMLLAEFRSVEALPALMELISVPGEGPFDWMGDLVTEDLPRILATLAAGQPELVLGLIDDPAINEYVRLACMQTIVCWVLRGEMPRHEAVKLLREPLRKAVQEEDCNQTQFLLTTLDSLWPDEARDEIRAAFQANLVEPFFIRWSDVQETLALGETAALERGRRFPRQFEAITDAVAEMRVWNWPGDKPRPAPQPVHVHPPRNWNFAPSAEASGVEMDEPSVSYSRELGTIFNDAPRIGRNEPCPCGSGKKYKKCCLRRTESVD
ncbi:MAG: DUF1186 domain-containing protein [Pirellulaceae bacterium]|nr:DUF1186 domain-containing protein [Pirellulaceae bacterium]